MYSPSHRHTMPVQRSASPPSFGKAEAVRTVREHVHRVWDAVSGQRCRESTSVTYVSSAVCQRKRGGAPGSPAGHRFRAG